MTLRSLAPKEDASIEWVAQRMRRTLVEVLGEERGTGMYTLDWLRARVRWHLDPEACTGDVFLLEVGGALAGHVIVRVEYDAPDDRFGLFSTIWIEPAHRRLGYATRLIAHGEAWMRAQGLARAATQTGAHHQPLQRLFEGHGYAITLRAGEMVRLTRDLG